MNWGGPTFVIAIIAICMGSWLINNWIRAKHGFEPTDDWGGTGQSGRSIADTRKIELLTNDVMLTDDQRLNDGGRRASRRRLVPGGPAHVAALQTLAASPVLPSRLLDCPTWPMCCPRYRAGVTHRSP